jgi:tRNA wybutosine-synthesizing protein 3
MDSFLQRKRDLLSKEDKSSKGGWDKHIENLCNKINESDDLYTTSSCSGRIVIMIDQEKKGENLFLFVSHEKVDSLKDIISNLDLSKDVKYKVDPCILHVACKDIDSAKELLKKALLSGWKRSGIMTFGKNIILELNATDKLEFPLARKGKILVGEDFLEVVLSESNKKLEKSWKKIDDFYKKI